MGYDLWIERGLKEILKNFKFFFKFYNDVVFLGSRGLVGNMVGKSFWVDREGSCRRWVYCILRGVVSGSEEMVCEVVYVGIVWFLWVKII